MTISVPNQFAGTATSDVSALDANFDALVNFLNSGVDFQGAELVSSYVAIRALTASTTSTTLAFTTGRLATGDGGMGWFRADPSDTTSSDNDGTILVAGDGMRWKRLFTGNVNVRWFGANGTADDTVAIQNALNVGDILVPPGTFNVDTLRLQDSTSGHYYGILVPASRSIVVDGDINAIPNASADSNTIFAVFNVSGVKIAGIGTLAGERLGHTGTTGTYGFCVDILGSTQVSVRGLGISNGWGDGIYIDSYSATPSQFVVIEGNKIHNNRRNNISVISGSSIRISGNEIYNANGTDPQAGIDVEPDAGKTCSDISISGNIFHDNANDGVRITSGAGTTARIMVYGNDCTGDCTLGSVTSGSISAFSVSQCSIVGNQSYSSGAHGIYMDSSNQIAVSYNIVQDPKFSGIRGNCGYSNFIGNQVWGASATASGTYDGLLVDGIRNTVIGNVVRANTTVQPKSAIGLGSSMANCLIFGNELDSSSAFSIGASYDGVFGKNISTTVPYTAGDTTPSVIGREVLRISNTVATSITALDDGTTDQIITILPDANSTLVGSTRLVLNASNFTGSATAAITLLCTGPGAAAVFTELYRRA